MVDAEPTKGDPSDKPERLTLHYIKSSSFRVIHADGALGGLTPRGYIHMTLYNERAAIPRTGLRELQADGTLTTEKFIEGREGVVREMEVDVLMDIRFVRELRDWLDRRVVEHEEVLTQQETKGK